MENLVVAFNCVLPAFVMLLTGYLAKRCGAVSEEIVPPLNRFCFTVLLSLYMFNNVYTADFDSAVSPGLILFLLAQTLALFIGGFVIVSRRIEDGRRRGAYLQAAFRSNIAIIGLTLAQTLMDDAGTASMAVVITVLVPVYNMLAVIALESFGGTAVSVGRLVKSIFKNTLVIGSLLGLGFSVLRVPIPGAVMSALTSMGKAGTVLALITLGISFNFSALSGNWRQVLRLSALRLVIIPAFTVGTGVLLGFRGNDLAVTMLVSAAPMASTAFSMARMYDSDYELTGQVVVATSFFCSLTLFVWIFLLKQTGLI